MTENPISLEMIYQALPFIARTTGGVAQVTDGSGLCLYAVGPDGARREDVEGKINEICLQVADQNKPFGLGEGDRDNDVRRETFALPLGEYVISATNEDRADRQSALLETLKQTLPLIATVAEGEAILFDRAGRRMLTANPKSLEPAKGDGTISASCLNVMQTNRPDIGPSRTDAEATAVRIPICSAFGFGFNNIVSVTKRRELLDQVRRNRSAKYTWDDIVSKGTRLKVPLTQAHSAADTLSSVVILGESGTGKELFAQAIHNASKRADKPFIAINCAALPENLVESTFFGYADGSFTGARKGGQAGLFEDADGGTLLLDEISEMPLDLQAKLLRVLQENEITRIGSSKPVPVDVRIICTCNRDLNQCVEEGSFRADLFYRLNVIDIYLPPLSEGKGDIPSLAGSIMRDISVREDLPNLQIDQRTMELLLDYDWPGNVRELYNALDRAVSLADHEIIKPEHLSQRIGGKSLKVQSPKKGSQSRNLKSNLAEAGHTLILDTLDRHNGNRTKTAKELGISVTTLWRRMQEIN
jgi:sigma-54 dependent transcriptional regulator, acetoin dehydrogenase operon transcriptional activator AcoR